METLDLLQGSYSIAWHEHRSKHYNASDAPAMLSESKHKNRSKFLHERQTGIIPDVDEATQRRFDDGHRFEALARPLAEEIIGDDLYPVTGVKGKLSASFDGINLDESIIFEHKSLNNDLRTVQSAEELPIMYRIQMEQQLYISDAEKCLFMASKWDNNDELIDEIHFWYEPDLELREKIIAGWEQFEADLEVWEPVNHQEKPVAEATESLPMLSIRVNGELAIVSNLGIFGEQLRNFVGRITKDPQDDQDFANLESAVKKLKEAEDALEKAENYALAQIEDVNLMRQAVSELKELARSSRLMSEKLVKSQKEVIKLNILSSARNKFGAYIAELQQGIKGVRIDMQEPDFGGAMKNKRTISSLHDAVDTLLAHSKSHADKVASDYRDKLAWCAEHARGCGFLLSDLQALIAKPREDFELAITSRIKDYQESERIKAETAEKERIEREERIAKEAAEKSAEAEREKIALEAKEIAEREILERENKVVVEQPVSKESVVEPTITDTATEQRTQVRPSRHELISAIAGKFVVPNSIAESWLVDTFSDDYTDFRTAINNCESLADLSIVLKEMSRSNKEALANDIRKRQSEIKGEVA